MGEEVFAARAARRSEAYRSDLEPHPRGLGLPGYLIFLAEECSLSGSAARLALLRMCERSLPSVRDADYL
jgi:hypothetical protein